MSAPLTLISVDDTRSLETGLYNISPNILGSQIAGNIFLASQRLRKWVGEEVYDDALNETPVDELRKRCLQQAEANLTMHFALAGFNTNITPGGVVLQSREEGQTVVQYLTPSQIKELKQLYLDQAVEIVEGGNWMLSDDVPDDIAISQ